MRAIPRATRIEVARHCDRGERHPDPAVAAAAERWARLELAPWPTSIPSVLLPGIGVLLTAAGLRDSNIMPMWLGVPFGVSVVLLGGLSWPLKRYWQQLTKLPPALPSNSVI
jgi:hypothetical protein